jgi:hypothetical protein
MKNPNDPIVNRTRILPACPLVPQPTAPPHTPRQKMEAERFSEMFVATILHDVTSGKHLHKEIELFLLSAEILTEILDDLTFEIPGNHFPQQQRLRYT